MRCDEVRDAAPELVLGTLDGAERALVLEHVDHCVYCREEIAALSGTVSDMALLAAPVRPSDGFADRRRGSGCDVRRRRAGGRARRCVPP